MTFVKRQSGIQGVVSSQTSICPPTGPFTSICPWPARELTAGCVDRRMVREGPCGHLDCPKPDDDGGQWYCLPANHGQSMTPGATCVCKRPACRRHFGMLPPIQKPGRKKAAASEPPQLTGNEARMPAKYILSSIHDIIGCRCAPARPSPPAAR